MPSEGVLPEMRTEYRLTEPVEVWIKENGCRATLLKGGVVTVSDYTLLYGQTEIIADIHMIRARSIRSASKLGFALPGGWKVFQGQH